MESENLELSLGLPGGDSSIASSKKKRVFSEIAEDRNSRSDDGKNQVVGWPPICSYRKNSFNERKRAEISRFYVKISMDGAPYLRKIDLNLYNGYSELSAELEKMFGCFGNGGFAGKDGSDCRENIPIYEDKDGDWMLVGDVPWGMFVESCKRLRIVKSSDAVGF